MCGCAGEMSECRSGSVLCESVAYGCTHTYIHIHTHTYTYIHIHIQTHTYIHTHTHTHTHTTKFFKELLDSLERESYSLEDSANRVSVVNSVCNVVCGLSEYIKLESYNWAMTYETIKRRSDL